MNVEQQGRNECMLATIAALQRRPLDHVRVDACRAARVDKWGDLFDPHFQIERYWQAVEHVAGPGLYPIVACRYAGAVPSGDKIPDVGRGVVVVTFNDSAASHIMPWESGLLYDPMDPYPHPIALQDWLRAHPTATILVIRSLKEREPMPHYHYGAGLHGYLYQDGPHTAERYEDAVESLVSAYELGKRRTKQLTEDGYLELSLKRDGNEYCEITECTERDCPGEDDE